MVTISPIACLRGWQLGQAHLQYGIFLGKQFKHFSRRNAVTRSHPLWKLPTSVLLLYDPKFFPSLLSPPSYLKRLGSPLRLALRLINLGLIFGTALALVLPFSFWVYISQRQQHQRIYRIYLWALRRAGATFIKLGQWAATRPDILPPELCTILAELHSGAPHHSMSWNRYLIRTELGHELEDIFDAFEERPLGSGTIAQVHRAILRTGQYTGLPVAIKLAHPHIEQHIERDLQLLRLGASLIHPLVPWLNLPEEVSYFTTMMRQQLDLRHEAYTLDHFGRNFMTWKTVSVPVPIYPYVTTSILTETLAEGTSIKDFLPELHLKVNKVDCPESIRKDLAYTGFAALLQMLLWDNFVHADLHPGNILVRFVERRTGQVHWSGPPSKELTELFEKEGHYWLRNRIIPQLVFLDTGLVTQLGRRDQKNFDDLFMALILRGDGYSAGRLLIERSPACQEQVIGAEEFCQQLDLLVRPIFREALELRNFALGPVLYRVFDLVREHRVRLDGAFTNLVMSFLCMEGLGRSLAPDFNLIPMLARGALQYLVTTAALRVQEKGVEYKEYYWKNK